MNLCNGNLGEWQYSDSPVTIDAWVHVAVTVDLSGANPVATFYINGINNGIKTYANLSSSSLHSTTSPLLIGRQGSSCQCNPFNGRIDDLSIWDRELDRTEICETMAAQLNGDETGLIAYYDFNDEVYCVDNTDSSNILVDAANSHNGTLHNFLFTGCISNWGSERNNDTDVDGVPDVCDKLSIDFCPNVADASIDFDPGTSGGNEINLNDPSGVVSYFPNSDFTIEAWVNHDGTAYSSILSSISELALNFQFLIFPDDDTVVEKPGRLGLFMTNVNNLNGLIISNSVVPKNKWTHIAVTYNESTRMATFFINGKADGTNGIDFFGGFIDPLSFQIGRFLPFHGSYKIDDFALWSKALTQNEIMGHYVSATFG